MSRNSIKSLLVVMLLFSGVSFAKEKFFEDTYIIEGLFYEDIKDMDKSAQIFNYLFEKTNNIEYLKRALDDEIDDENQRVSKRLLKDANRYLKSAKESKNREEIAKKLAVIYLETGDRVNRDRVIKSYLENSKNIDTLLFLAELYSLDKEYEKSYEILKKIYKISPSPKVVIQEAKLLYNHLNRKDEAKRLLNSYIKLNKSKNINLYFTLINIYINDKDIDNALRVYKELYTIKPHKIILEKIIKLYLYKKDIKGLSEFLQKHREGNEKILYMVYRDLKDLNKALELSKELYNKTKEPQWLAKEAMLIYEKAQKEHKITPAILNKVFNLFDRAIKEGANDSIYLNYYGYTLIDHNVDIKKGIELVKKALKQKPNNQYYLDSLAWGYYKEGKCQEAKKIMDRAVELGTLKEREMREHKIKIDECANKTK